MKKKKGDDRKIKFIAGIEKEFGKGLAEFADDASAEIERLSMGIAQVDWLTMGGLPLGKVSLFRGAEGGTKTTMAIIACARYLERFPDRLAVYIDAEEKYPEQFVKRLGMDGSRFVKAAPETAEETIDFLDYTLRQRPVGILVLDSIASLLPKIEREEPMEKQQQGQAARLVNKAVRKMVGAMRARRVAYKWSPTVILINQERFKIGVCFDYWTRVLLADGSMQYIGKIVSQKLPIKVKTVSNGQIVERKVIGWFKRAAQPSLSFLIKTAGQVAGFRCTSEHPILTPKGFIEAKRLKTGNEVITITQSTLTNKVGPILGTLLGDGCIKGEDGLCSALRITHGIVQKEYLRYKIKLLGIAGNWRERTTAIHWESGYHFELGEMRRRVYEGGEWKLYKKSQRRSLRRKHVNAKKRFNKWVIENLDLLGLTLWYLDDGTFIDDRRNGSVVRSCFCVKGFARKDQTAIVSYLKKRGYFCWLMKTGNICLSIEGTHRFANDIKSYVPKCMQYKLPEEYRGFFKEPQLSEIKKTILVPGVILKINTKSQMLTRAKTVYDLRIDGSNNFIVGGKTGVVVHNSWGDPSTIPGGEGQKFASSLILKMRALAVKEDDRKDWGLPEEHPVVKVATTVVKHSFGPRGKGAEYLLAMDSVGKLKAGEAFDHEFVRILAMKRGLVGQNGRGSEKIAQEIAERRELYQKLKAEILEGRTA